MLAARAAAEIVAGDEDLRVAIGRLVQDEVRVLAAVILVALIREQALAKPGTLDGLEVLLGDHHVGVDIDHLQGRRDAFKLAELVHLAVPGWVGRFFYPARIRRESPRACAPRNA